MSDSVRTYAGVRAGRVFVGVSIANVLVYFASMVTPEQILSDVENIIIVGVTTGLAYLGEWLGESGLWTRRRVI